MNTLVQTEARKRGPNRKGTNKGIFLPAAVSAMCRGTGLARQVYTAIGSEPCQPDLH